VSVSFTAGAAMRPLLEPHLPPQVAPRWFTSIDEAIAMARDTEIGWLDVRPTAPIRDIVMAAGQLRWLNTLFAGTDHFPLDTLVQRGTMMTNGVGVNTIPVAEYAVMGMLAAAKNFAQVVRIGDAREWPEYAPGTAELFESRALIVGMGAIGQAIAERLAGFGVAVTGVRRRDGVDWRAQLDQYDWVILAAPATAETQHMMSTAEFAAMKPTAWIVNIGRGSLVDQDALVAALDARAIAGAVLDVTDPEPLPPAHPLWGRPNVLITMHFSGRSQTRMFERAARLFLANLDRYLAGEPLHNLVDLSLGY